MITAGTRRERHAKQIQNTKRVCRENFLVFVDFANNHFGNKSQLNPYIQRAVLNFRKRTKLSLLKNPDLLGGQLYQI